MNKNIAILGCGWLGLPLAVSLVKAGYKVKGSTTSSEKLTTLENASISPFLIHLKETGIEGAIDAFLSETDTLFIDIPPGLRKDPSGNYVAKIQHLIFALQKTKVSHVIFASSTSVYGNIEGSVTELTTPTPNTESGKQLLKTENLLLKEPSFKTTILRFAGLIGEDRHPITFLSGKKGIKHPEACVNLVHRTDCMEIIQRIIEQEPKEKVFNVAYPSHPSKKEYYEREANRRKLEPPQFESSGYQGKCIESNLLMKALAYNFQKDINL
ncbi:SDR family oxidoreductase [Flavobacteriaceae bacterium M23B6Z8]